MNDICYVGGGAVDANDVTVYALFEDDGDGDPNTHWNGLFYEPTTNQLCNDGATPIISGVYEYRYAFENGGSDTSRAGYLAVI